MATTVIPYDATKPSATARAADRALEGCGYHVSVGLDWCVCIVARNAPYTCAAHLGVGEQLVIESSGTWRIEDVSSTAAVTS